jgi:hypothetical protein
MLAIDPRHEGPALAEQTGRVIRVHRARRARKPIPLENGLAQLREGSDPENISVRLSWQDFEMLVEAALRSHDFRTRRHLVFKHKSRRHEIDLLAAREKIALCIDCKHWDHGWSPARIRKAVLAQRERTRALAGEPVALSNALHQRGPFLLLPAIVGLRTVDPTCTDGTPVVSILRLADFLRGVSRFREGLAFEQMECPQTLDGMLSGSRIDPRTPNLAV